MCLEAIYSLTISEAEDIARYYENDESWDFWEFMRVSVHVYPHPLDSIILLPTLNHSNSQVYTQER